MRDEYEAVLIESIPISGIHHPFKFIKSDTITKS